MERTAERHVVEARRVDVMHIVRVRRGHGSLQVRALAFVKWFEHGDRHSRTGGNLGVFKQCAVP